MTQQEALYIVCKYAKLYLGHLEDTRDEGPEGIEVYLQPTIDEIYQAVVVLKGVNDGKG